MSFEPWTTRQVRQTFFDFYQSKEHAFIPSSPLIPIDDPTRLFANAGMNQFRPVFLSTSNGLSNKCVFNSQKCIRMGDLDAVGKDSYHHTFFEMLGAWSFDDYFKKEAITYTWELLTEIYKIPKERLYVTYFEGDPSIGIAADEETKQLWLDVGVAEDHVLTGNADDNFWDMDGKAGTGPCGPCTEVHYDRIGGRNAAALVNIDDPDVIEIWNNVFIQFSREADGSLHHLGANFVDTAVGFERLASAVQALQSNYDTDVFRPLLHSIHQASAVRPYGGKFGAEDTDDIDTAYRIVADHSRSLAFAIADGGIPGHSGRGYVIRQLLRRGAGWARIKLAVPLGSFFSSLLPSISAQMGDIYPELLSSAGSITELQDSEEGSLLMALEAGEQLIQEVSQSGARELSLQHVQSLHSEYDLPLHLIDFMAKEWNLAVNEGILLTARSSKSKEFTRGW